MTTWVFAGVNGRDRLLPELLSRLVLLLWVLLENLGYRQLSVVWRLRDLVRYLCGGKGWGAMEREGFNLGESLTTLAHHRL